MKTKTRIQQSYQIGAGMDHDLGGVPGHVYLESRGTNIEIEKLRAAWKKTLRLHEISSPLNDYLPYFDIFSLTWAEAESEIQKYRQAFEQRNTSEEENHTCGLALFRMPENVYSLHFDMNLSAADPAGFQIFLGHLAMIYREKMPSLCKIHTDQKSKDFSAEDVDYWKKQTEDMRPGFHLQARQKPSDLHHCRYIPIGERLPPSEWKNVQNRANSFHVYPTAVVLADFAGMLQEEIGEDFILNLPVFGTSLDAVENPNHILDRTRLLTLSVKKSDSYKDILSRYQEGIRHIRYDGLDVQTILKKKYPDESLIAPIVFSATPGIQLITEDFYECFGDLYYMVSQTPQVCLDAQIYEMYDDSAYVVWMIPEGLFDQQNIDKWFLNFKNRMKNRIGENNHE